MTKFAQSQFLFKMDVHGVIGYVHAYWSNGEWKTRTFKSAPTIAGGLKAQNWDKVKDKLADAEGLVEKVIEAIKLLESKLQPRLKIKNFQTLGLVPARQIPSPKKKKTAA